MTAQKSFNARIYYSTGTDVDAMTELAHVRNASIAMSCDPEPLTPHDNGGWQSSTHSLRSVVFSWDMMWDITDAGLLALRDAFLNDSPILLRFNDGASDDPLNVSNGFAASCIITGFKRNERITDAISVSIEAKPTLSDIDPVWLEGLLDGDNGQWVYDDITGDPVLVAA